MRITEADRERGENPLTCARRSLSGSPDVGAAAGHLYQMATEHNFTPGNAGVAFLPGYHHPGIRKRCCYGSGTAMKLPAPSRSVNRPAWWRLKGTIFRH